MTDGHFCRCPCHVHGNMKHVVPCCRFSTQKFTFTELYMGLSFDEYQKSALSTAVYPRQYVLMAGQTIKLDAPSCIYPVFGLCGESGEVAEVLLDKSLDHLALKKECGDVCWYMAAVCSDLSLDMSDVAGFNTFEEFQSTHIADVLDNATLAAELCIATSKVAEHTKKTIRDHGGVWSDDRRTAIMFALHLVAIVLSEICICNGIELEDVAKTNLAKLASRKTAGTIQGSGNSR